MHTELLTCRPIRLIGGGDKSREIIKGKFYGFIRNVDVSKEAERRERRERGEASRKICKRKDGNLQDEEMAVRNRIAGKNVGVVIKKKRGESLTET